MKNKKVILPIAMLLLLIVATIGVTFATFTFSKQGNVENTIETGTVTLTYTEGKTGITLNEAYPMSDEKGKVLVGENNVFDFTVQANLSRTMSIGYEVTAVKIPITDVTPLEDDEVKLYLELAIDPDTNYSEVFAPSYFVPREEQTEIGSPIGSMILDSGTFTEKGTTIHNYRLRMWIDESTIIPSGESRKYGVKINVYAKQDILATPVEPSKNKNITAIYQYNQNKDSDTFCVTGEEDTCVELKTPPETYEAGTIIKYKVNDTKELYFHVMFDEGDTLILQQRENTVNQVAWYAEGRDNTKGPITILPVLESATEEWKNVLSQTYTLGTTIFKDNKYTGCTFDSATHRYNCVINTYTLGERIAKSRLISVQEAQLLGCTTTAKSCPIWMYNYLEKSTDYGGTMNQGSDWGYWTSSAYSSPSESLWGTSYRGDMVNNGYTSMTGNGARAVVEINK